MKEIKHLLLMLIVLSILISTSSCGVGSGNNSDADSGGEGTGEEENESPGEGGEDESDESIEDTLMWGETLYYSKSEIAFISSGDSGSREAADKIMNTLIENVIGDSGRAFVGSVYIPEGKYNEIIVGYVPERSISVKAYELLEQRESESMIRESRYVIYADNGSMALAYENNPYTSVQSAAHIADDFIAEFLEGKSTVILKQGVLASGTLNMIELQEKFDEKETEDRWQAIREKLGDEDVYLALRSFFEKLFNDDIISWMATLYDPATGLFYSSTSGKNANIAYGGTGYYPHPEATNGILNRLNSTGMLRYIGTDYTKFLPADMQYKMVYYLKSIQGSDGEFYVAQMNKSTIAPERVGRDHSACVAMLSKLNASPTYDVDKYKGDGISADEYWADLVAKGLTTEDAKPVIYWHWSYGARGTANINEKVTEAVSRAVAASDVRAVATGTSMVESHDAFISHLLTKDPYNSPYGGISNINSISPMINSQSVKLGAYNAAGDSEAVAKTVNVRVGSETKKLEICNGDTLHDISVKWLNLYVNDAGLFGKITNGHDSKGNPIYDGFYGGWGYNNTNGFMKSATLYGSAKAAFPKPREAAESLLKAINNPESAAANGNILVVYNAWSCLVSLRSNVKSYYEGDDKQEILDMIENGLYGKYNYVTGETGDRTYGAVAIDASYQQIQPFKKADAGYGHSPSQGTSGWQGGLPVGIASENLSDTDATFCTTTSLGSCIASAFGLNMSKDIPMHTEADLLLFLDIVSEQEYVIKKTPTELKYGKSAMGDGEHEETVTVAHSTSGVTAASSASEMATPDACLNTSADGKSLTQDKRRKSNNA